MLYPFDDSHRYHRPAAIVSQSMGGIKVADALKFMCPEPEPVGMSDADLRTMATFGMTPPRK